MARSSLSVLEDRIKRQRKAAKKEKEKSRSAADLSLCPPSSPSLSTAAAASSSSESDDGGDEEEEVVPVGLRHQTPRVRLLLRRRGSPPRGLSVSCKFPPMETFPTVSETGTAVQMPFPDSIQGTATRNMVKVLCLPPPSLSNVERTCGVFALSSISEDSVSRIMVDTTRQGRAINELN